MEDNPTAFPWIREFHINGSKCTEHMPGMTLRDWFAGQVISHVFKCAYGVSNITRDDVVSEAYHIADSMLERRKVLKP